METLSEQLKTCQERVRKVSKRYKRMVQLHLTHEDGSKEFSKAAQEAVEVENVWKDLKNRLKYLDQLLDVTEVDMDKAIDELNLAVTEEKKSKRKTFKNEGATHDKGILCNSEDIPVME